MSKFRAARIVLLTALLPMLAVFLYQVRELAWKARIAQFKQVTLWPSFSRPLKMPGQVKNTHFRTIQKFQTDYAPITISQYVSERTGMHVVLVDQKGPKVNGYFALATEIFDDSGSPHTLEHLVFMGSKNYQYKGILDKLATRAYSNTNAWTATDHTAYTLDTAGWEGFAQILPVYLEHVILPTLTDEGCYTEVHHVDGEGNDAGVVYSEMQGVQNNGGEIMDIRARQLLYPEGVGFRYETGGLMEQLRVLTAERIRAFHREMYQPKNLCLVLIGEINHDQLFDILDNFEESILDDIPSPDTPFKRPWVDSPQAPPLEKTIIETVNFPEEDESSGEILVGMFGPDCNDPVQTAALNVLLTYLAGSSVSILENVMVEKEELASSIGFWWDSRPSTVIWFQPTGVATKKLAHVEKRLFELLEEVASKPIDMNYMSDCLKRELRQLKFQAESSSSFYATGIINDHLFGKRDGSTLKDLGTIKEYAKLEAWADEDWRAFLRKWITDAPHVSILGTPSKELSDSIKAQEEARIAKRKEELGPEGLQKLADKLSAAIAKNDLEIPTSLLQKWPVPGVDSIHFIESMTARSGLAKREGTPSNKIQQLIDSQDETSPLFIQFEHVPTNFVHISLLIGTSELPKTLKPILPIFLDNFFNTPISRENGVVDFEQVVTELEQDTISYSMAGGGRIGDAEGVVIQFQIEPEKYTTAIEWIRTMMFDSIFDKTRLKAGITKILADIPDSKRSGNSMMYAVDAMVHLNKDSITKARGTLVKSVYMKRLKKLLEFDTEVTLSWFNSIRTCLFKFHNIRALVIANVETLPNPLGAWKPLVDRLGPEAPLLPIIKQSSRLSPDGQSPGSYGAVVVPMPPIDSSFCMSTVRGPTSYDDPALPALLVAISFLEAVEGPLWTAIRGTGLAYGASFGRDLEGGFLQFKVYRSPDAYRAFVAGKTIIENYLNGKETFEEYALEGAISGIVVAMADEQPTMAAAGQLNFINGVIRGVTSDYNSRMLKAVRKVEVDHIKKAMEEYLLPAFLPGKANVIVTCSPATQEAIVKGFTDSGFKTQIKPLSDFEDYYGLGDNHPPALSYPEGLFDGSDEESDLDSMDLDGSDEGDETDSSEEL